MGNLLGYAGRVLRVDLGSGRHSAEPLDDDLARGYIGGRGLNARVLFEEVPPSVDALGPENKLLIGVGPLDGTLYPGSRFNMSAKSPLTGILGDSNAGGFFGPELKFAGYDQVIVDGAASHPVYLLITDERVEIRDARHLWGRDVWETTVALREELGDQSVQVACIGQGGENLVRYAGVFANLVRCCARTGMGAVMGSKMLKAVVCKGEGAVRVADPERFMVLIDRCWQEVYEHPNYKNKCIVGSTSLMRALNELGLLATHHFQTGYFPDGERVTGQRLAHEFNVRRKACFSCNMPCSRVFVVPDGPYKGLMSEGPEFEALAGFTSRVGNSDMALALKCIDMCNRYGLDAISASEVISFCMELWQRGILGPSDTDGLDFSWGNGQTLISILDRIVSRQGLGDILADGVRSAAQQIGRGSEQLAVHTKGLELIPCDPRGLKAYALGYAVASRGGDHLRAEPFFEMTNDRAEGLRRFGHEESALRLEWRGKGRLVKYFEEWCAVCDSFDVCKNSMVCMEVVPYDRAAELLEAVTGQTFSAEEVRLVGERIVNLERCYLVEAGIRRIDDSLPDRFLNEPLPEDSKLTAGQIVELDLMLDDYYRDRDWDVTTGIPSLAKLDSLGLGFAVARLADSGVKLT